MKKSQKLGSLKKNKHNLISSVLNNFKQFNINFPLKQLLIF